jgi:hypothetical protein
MSDKPQPRKAKPRLGARCGVTGKVRFKSHAAAMRRGFDLAESPKWNSEIIRVYQCTYCGGWHLTSKPTHA